jgi:hypothetical protein
MFGKEDGDGSGESGLLRPKQWSEAEVFSVRKMTKSSNSKYVLTVGNTKTA